MRRRPRRRTIQPCTDDGVDCSGPAVSAADDLLELVERVGAAERSALAAKWKDRDGVESLLRSAKRSIAERRDLDRGAVDGSAPTIDRADAAHGDVAGTSASPSVPLPSDAVAAGAEADAKAAVAAAAPAIQEAHLAVLEARLALIDAGETEPGAAAVAGYAPLPGRNAVSRHGPLWRTGCAARSLYILTRKPRSVARSLAISLALGLLYLGFLRLFEWDTKQRLLPYLGLWAISVVMGGAVCLNAMSFDAMRVRAALDSGARLWHVLVIKNLALLVLVAPLGFLISVLLAWRSGDFGALFKACALMLYFILLWLGVGNVLSLALPIRDEPLRKRRQSGSLKQFLMTRGGTGRGDGHEPRSCWAPRCCSSGASCRGALSAPT